MISSGPMSATPETAGVPPLAGRERALEPLLASGSVLIDGPILRVPQTRWLHMDSIIAKLF